MQPLCRSVLFLPVSLTCLAFSAISCSFLLRHPQQVRVVPEHTPSSRVMHSSVEQRIREEDTKIFCKGGMQENMRKPVPGGSCSSVASSTAAPFCFLGLSCGMEQLLSMVLGKREFTVPGVWREKQIKKG